MPDGMEGGMPINIAHSAMILIHDQSTNQSVILLVGYRGVKHSLCQAKDQEV
jgi:hypothetical protein